MSIRSKIVLIVLPLVVTPLVITAVVASLSARNGITGVATRFLAFKSDQIVNYAQGQWQLLESNNLADDDAYVNAAEQAVAAFARSVVRSDTERIFAVGPEGSIPFSTGAIDLREEESRELAALHAEGHDGWTEPALGGTTFVAHAAPLPQFDWSVFVAEEEAAFFASANAIIYQVGAILAAALAVSVLMLIFFSGYLTRPLRFMVGAMNDIISTSDLSKRVEVLYKDETGTLSQTFNVMIQELQSAYDNVKGYALQAALARTKEQKIRTLFQKYVPADVISQVSRNPEAMLVGDNRKLAVLFSDIRSFTSISEGLQPDEVVDSLNRYFKLMVDAIMERNGIVDKYIGDAIMAFYGAPIAREDDALQATLSALEMLDRLHDFNEWQTRQGRPEFKIGIGINFGTVTVGNIGSDKRMDYTVIGDMVNVASRLEGLTKKYRQELLVADTVADKLSGEVPTRLLDRVKVKGRSKSLGVYAAKRSITEQEELAWDHHNAAMTAFYSRRFEEAGRHFERVTELLPEDPAARDKLALCRQFRTHPPEESWSGEIAMTEK